MKKEWSTVGVRDPGKALHYASKSEAIRRKMAHGDWLAEAISRHLQFSRAQGGTNETTETREQTK